VLAVVLVGGTDLPKGASGGDLSGEQLARDSDAKADKRSRVECFISCSSGQ